MIYPYKVPSIVPSVLPSFDAMFLLDEYIKSVVPASYSLRQLKSSALFAIRVRRSSDSLEANVGFVSGLLDVGSLLAFVGVDSGYVVTWYDQSGNGNHATQATAGSQPRIVNAGILERDFDSAKCLALYPTFASASTATMITNGNFVGTTGWTAVTGCVLSNGTANTLTSTGDGASSAPMFYQAVPSVAKGRRMFVTAIVKVTNSVCSYVELDIRASGGSLGSISLKATPAIDTLYTVSAVIIGSDAVTRIGFRHNYADAATANGKVMEVQEFVCIDVTNLGQPSVYFDGSNDVLTIANSASVDILGAPLLLNSVTNSMAIGIYLFCKNGLSAAEIQYALNFTGSSQALYLEGASRQTTNALLQNNQYVVSCMFTTGAQQGYINGSVSGLAGNYNGALTTRANVQIGARSNNAGGTAWSAFFKGYMSEIIISTNTTARSKIEKSQGKYYGIAVS